EYLHAQDAMFQELLPVDVIEADVLALEFQPSSLVAMNFTLQFIPREQRPALLNRIRQALVPGGALILSEKLRFEDEQEHALLTNLHVAFKRANRSEERRVGQECRSR